MLIRISSKFRKSYKKLPANIKNKAKEKEKIFRNNSFDARLDAHKLHGKYKNYWAFTITDQYRIMFTFAESNIVDFIDIGDHKIYR